MDQSKNNTAHIPSPMNPSLFLPRKQTGYGFYSQNQRLYNAEAEGSIFFHNPPIQTSGFVPSDQSVRIKNAGAYLFTYQIHFPQEIDTKTILSLQIGEHKIAAMTKLVDKPAVGVPYTLSIQGIAAVAANTFIQLISSEHIDFSSPTDDVIAALTIIQL